MGGGTFRMFVSWKVIVVHLFVVLVTLGSRWTLRFFITFQQRAADPAPIALTGLELSDYAVYYKNGIDCVMFIVFVFCFCFVVSLLVHGSWF